MGMDGDSCKIGTAMNSDMQSLADLDMSEEDIIKVKGAGKAKAKPYGNISGGGGRATLKDNGDGASFGISHYL